MNTSFLSLQHIVGAMRCSLKTSDLLTSFIRALFNFCTACCTRQLCNLNHHWCSMAPCLQLCNLNHHGCWRGVYNCIISIIIGVPVQYYI